MSRTITAYFDSRAEAQSAADQLRNAGVSTSDVSLHDAAGAGTGGASATATSEDKGFWASLGDLFMPDEDRHAYSEGIRRGGSVLSVRADDADFERVSDILEGAGAVDLDSREAEWRSEGWSGYEAGTTSTAGYAADRASTGGTSSTTGISSTGATGSSYGTTGTTGSSGYEATRTGATTSGAYAAGSDLEGGADYIPVAEEQLRVGKREVDHGRVRVRSYVVDTPVEESVSLREERVSVDRQAVDRPATGADHLFREQTIEAQSYGEEAVVSKDARVVEEVRLNKDVDTRNETIRDTVRRTEVEVEDDRATRATDTVDDLGKRRNDY